MNQGLSTSPTPKSQNSTSLLPLALGVGIVSFYILFTLLPNSNSMMVKWPWVFIWQVGLMLGPIALLSQLWQNTFRRLGGWLDWLAAAWCLTFVLSAAFAEFFHQAVWYGWAAICGIAYLYVLNSWLTSTRRVQTVLVSQGVLSILFSAQSLTSWYFQTVRPYLQHIEELQAYGIERSFDLQILTLRNWHPLGHQNYVAGYLILTLPLLFGLAFSCKGWQRFAWLGGAALSLATLYSTASRAGWFALAASIAVFIGLCAWHFPKLRKVLFGTSIVSFGLMVLWGVQSDRIRTLFLSLINHNDNAVPSYRAITNATGWFMGLDHPILGAGLGSVTLLYQKYRPEWAGREAELTYQLHSTPAQLWAELGIAGVCVILLSIIAILILGIKSCNHSSPNDKQSVIAFPLLVGVISGLVGYAVYSTTDYQLDNICISAILIIFCSGLICINRENSELLPSKMKLAVVNSIAKRATLAGTALLIAISTWLYPIHRAWMLSSSGFLALQQNNFPSFISHLETAHQLAPWEPYYPYQLGWNIGELAFKNKDVQQQEELRKESLVWFEKAIERSPNREFGYSNVGWLQVNSDPQRATQTFLKAAQLTPEKQGIYFALGYSLLKGGNPKLAVRAMLMELINQPIFLTSPIWREPELIQIYPRVLTSLENELSRDFDNADTREERLYSAQVLGSLQWWQGSFNKAQNTFEQISTPLNRAIIALAEASIGEKINAENISDSDNVAAMAWQKPEESQQLLQKAIIQTGTDESMPPSDFVLKNAADIAASMQNARSFQNWVTQKVPARRQRFQRLGFGTISRHIDGPIPSDFFLQSKNAAEAILLQALFPPPATVEIENIHALLTQIQSDL